jgi:hypothetical protein
MEGIFEFSAYNSESIYGFGTQAEASLYLDWLNKDREINLYEMAESSMTMEQADTLAVNLLENLQDLDLIDAGDE